MPYTLFQPLRFASVTTRNRVVMAPMVTNFAGPDDEVTDRQISYYAERARGGVGTIVVEASHVCPEGRITSRQIGCYDDRFITGLSRLAGRIKSEGALALLQLVHGGPKILATAGVPSKSFSPIEIRKGIVPHSLTLAELRGVRTAFVAAARRAFKAGFDAIELHAAHFYLLSASISPFTNRRTDRYGGSTINRARFVCEIVHDIKMSLGAGWPVWVRINACEDLQSGLHLEEGQQVATLIAAAGADAIHVSAYTLPISNRLKGTTKIHVGAIPHKHTPSGPFLKYAAAIKQAIDVPVIAVGKLDNPLLAESALTEGKCDMIALGRQLLCDPYWSLKVENNRVGEIIHCHYCSTCHMAQQRGKEVRCVQNLNLYGEPTYRPRSSRSQPAR